MPVGTGGDRTGSTPAEASAGNAKARCGAPRPQAVAFLAQAFGELGLTPAKARRQALPAYSTYVGRAHLARDAPELLGDQAGLSRHIAEQLIG